MEVAPWWLTMLTSLYEWGKSPFCVTEKQVYQLEYTILFVSGNDKLINWKTYFALVGKLQITIRRQKKECCQEGISGRWCTETVLFNHNYTSAAIKMHKNDDTSSQQLMLNGIQSGLSKSKRQKSLLKWFVSYFPLWSSKAPGHLFNPSSSLCLFFFVCTLSLKKGGFICLAIVVWFFPFSLMECCRY